MRLALLFLLSAASAGATQPTKSPAPPLQLVQPEKKPGSLSLYAPDGTRIAQCERGADDKFTNCQIENGYSLNDLMNAWVQAYLDKDVEKGKQ